MSLRLLLILATAACGAPPAPSGPALASSRSLVVLPVESAAFPRSAKLATDLLRRARVRGFDPPTMGKVSLEIVQLSIECVDPTFDCYVAVARSLGAKTVLFGQIARGPREGELQFTVSLLDAAGKRWIKRASKLFPSEDDAAYDMHLVVDEATRP